MLFKKKRKSVSDKKIYDKPKDVKQILDEQIETSLHEFNRSNIGLFISSFAGGMEVGFSVLLMGTIFTLFAHDVSPELLHVLLSFCYPIGFIFVIIGRSELFTEHTALAVLPVLNRSVGISSLMILWGLVYGGNLLGGYLFSLLISQIGIMNGFIYDDAFLHLANELTHHKWYNILLSGMVAGWMMGLLGWLLTSSQETISRIFVIILVTATIGIAGLHHCIVGSIEVFSGMLVHDSIVFYDYLHFLVWATLGNILGGVVFVALLKFGHIRMLR
ncbi:MAG: formate/nitrite transporter family protein [Flammeovirgaceae bacterium]